MIQAIIFDMDGTMIDTEHLWKEVNMELSIRHGVVYDEIVRLQMMGRKEDDALRVFKEYFHLAASVDALVIERKEMMMEQIHRISKKPGLVELLDLIDKLHLKKAIATSSFRDFASKAIETVGLTSRFTTFVTGDEITNGKPHPEIFLDAAKKLGVEPENCLVLEDAQNGVEAGYNAKMKVFAIPHQHSAHHDFSKATKILKSMEEVNEELLKSL